MMPFQWKFPILNWRVVDGDTLHVMLDQGMNNRWVGYVRLEGIDTPELKINEQKASAEVAKKSLHKMMNQCKNPWIDSSEFDKYGRVLGYVRAENLPESTINQMMLDEGKAKAYTGNKRSWTPEELEAIK